MLKELHALLPDENTVYLGDTARVPYGIRSRETVIRYSFENTSFLIEKGIKLLVIACNTASAMGLRELERAFPIPVIGVMEPGARASIFSTETGRIGIIGTEATIRSGAYRRVIHDLEPDIKIFEKACPLFVPLVEEGWFDDQVTELTAGKYLGDLRNLRIDTLVLGCTHYPLLKKVITGVMGETISLIDSAVETVKVVKAVLTTSGLLSKGEGTPVRKYFVTDYRDRFIHLSRMFLNKSIHDIEMINLSCLESRN